MYNMLIWFKHFIVYNVVDVGLSLEDNAVVVAADRIGFHNSVVVDVVGADDLVAADNQTCNKMESAAAVDSIHCLVVVVVVHNQNIVVDRYCSCCSHHYHHHHMSNRFVVGSLVV